ncbi:hypothetical protein ES703_76540 [subsurface metagenome]
MPSNQWSYEVYYQVAMNRLEAQLNEIEAIDRKVAMLLSFASAIVTIFFTAGLYTLKPTDLHLSVLIPVSILSGLAIVIYIALVVFSLIAYHVRNWSLRPDLQTLKLNSSSYSEESMRIWVADQCILSMQVNEPRIRSKATAARKAVWLLGLETSIFALIFLILLCSC